jgi:hypothetical protein
MSFNGILLLIVAAGVHDAPLPQQRLPSRMALPAMAITS